MKIEYTIEWFESNANTIEEWFNPETMEWGNGSFLLSTYCLASFDLWFNPDKFDWYYSGCLAMGYSDRFDDWFDPKKFDWTYSFCSLAEHCLSNFKKWFDPVTFNWAAKEPLVDYCITYIDDWYDSSKFEESYDELLLMSIK